MYQCLFAARWIPFYSSAFVQAYADYACPQAGQLKFLLNSTAKLRKVYSSHRLRSRSSSSLLQFKITYVPPSVYSFLTQKLEWCLFLFVVLIKWQQLPPLLHTLPVASKLLHSFSLSILLEFQDFIFMSGVLSTWIKDEVCLLLD